jgi:hypothetical protein
MSLRRDEMQDVREKHGAAVHNGHTVVVTEREDCLKLWVHDGSVGRDIFLTPNEARYLASKLKRLARRVDDRIIGR